MNRTTYIQCKNEECQRFTDKSLPLCTHCGAANGLKEVPRVHGVAAFPSGWFRDIDFEPVYVKGRKQLLHETRRRGQVSFYAED